MKKVMRIGLAALLLFGAPGCGILTEPGPIIDEFAWEAEANPANITEGVDMAGVFASISFLGQVKTTNLCYSVASTLEVDGSDVTIRVTLTNSGAPNCNQTMGGFRYSGIVRNLPSGTYNVKLIQVVGTGAPTEVTKSIRV
jgi:hypothetical protein